MVGKKYATTNPDVIRRWAEMRHGAPVAFHRGELGDDKPLLGFAFPDYDNPNSYEEITWQTLFNQRAAEQLVFLYQEKTETGEMSHYNRFVSQQVADEEVSVSMEAEAEAESTSPDALGPTESHETPLARGRRAVNHPELTSMVSKTTIAGLLIVIVLAFILVWTVFWPQAS
jgi:hypothetical protein